MEMVDVLGEDFPIRRIRNAIGSYMTRQFHDIGKERYSDCFVLVFCGEVMYVFEDGRKILVNGKKILYLPKNSRYSMDVRCDRYEFIYVDFDFDLPPGEARLPFCVSADETEKNLFMRMRMLFTLRETAYCAEASGLLYRIYAMLLRKREQPYMSRSGDVKLRAAMAYLAEHFTETGLSASAISKAVSVSPAHLRRIFTERLGMPPVRYIATLRVNYAKGLLAGNLYSIGETALRSGFSNRYYFSRVFSEYVGCTPSEYLQHTRD